MSSGQNAAPRASIANLGAKVERGEKLVLVSAYDALFARIAEAGGVDAVLVGDSLGNVIAGFDSTIPVTLDQMIYHARAARCGLEHTPLIIDMPFLTYQVTVEDALRNCGRAVQQTGAHAVKLEGASDAVQRAVRGVTGVGVPVMAHIGYTPQSAVPGRARVQGRGEDASRLVDEARWLEDAGAFAIVLELVTADAAAQITEAVSIPTIGIGSGVQCDGQVLVLLDLLGLNDRFAPRFLKKYGELGEAARDAVRRFAADVRAGTYPSSEHSF